jgi:hypothetical protein
MSKHIKPGELGAALEEELTIYGEAVNDALAGVISESIDDLVTRTKATAPKKTGRFRKQIAAEKRQLNRRGGGGLRGQTLRATWYVKAPDYRRTHLLVHGHATRNGGRTKADPFLQNALDAVLPEYERKVEEVLKNGK